jgi:tRNA pseudouridine38-40 synthase
MRNIKLMLEYDGTNYVGWQRQNNGKSIQGEIEKVLQQILQERVNVIGAGRTDAGVHARGQTANFKTVSPMRLETLHAALNALLPDDISVTHVEEVPLDFHARYSAKERTYSYRIISFRSPLVRNIAWYCPYTLELPTMEKIAQMIIGEHDFQSFSKAGANVRHYRCRVRESYWVSSSGTIQYWITADRFLHGMVRALVGTMVEVGRGYTTIEEFKQILEKKNRSEAGMTAPAKGLILERVCY